VKERILLLLIALSALLSGCSAGLADGPATPAPNETTTQQVTNQTTVEFLAVDSNLGRAEEPIELVIRNTGNESETVDLRIERDDTLVFRRTFELGSGARVNGTIDYEDSYTITFQQGEETEVIEVTPIWFDCNDTTTTVTVSGSSIDSETMSTLMACPRTPIEDLRDYLRELVT